MIDADDDMPEREALAAEYVLGTLSLPERLTAAALIESDARFAALVADWQERLSPLNDDYEDVAPPANLLGRIESRLFPAPPATRRWTWLWGGLAGTALAALAVLVVLPVLTPPPPVTATLTGCLNSPPPHAVR